MQAINNEHVEHHVTLAMKFIDNSVEGECVAAAAAAYLALYGHLQPPSVADDFNDPYLREHMNGFGHRFLSEDLNAGIELGARALARTVDEAASNLRHLPVGA